MTKRIFSASGIGLISFVIMISLFVTTNIVRGAPQDYTATYNVTNVYTNHTLNYNLSGLDSATQYTFQFQLMDEANNFLDVIDTSIIGPGVTTATFGTDFASRETAYGPLRVIDNFQQVLGKHFVAPAYASPWISPQYGIGDVPYQPNNAHGFQHPIEDHTAVLTVHGDWTLLHYNIGALAPPTDRFIRLMDSSSHATVATFSVDELYNYNRQDGTTWSPTFEGISFVVLNTDGSVLPFINETEDTSSFLGVYANPHELSINTGVYQYAAYNGAGVFQTAGESVWIVSSATDGTEWDVGLKSPSVAPGGQQCASLYQTTSAVFNGYPDQLLADSSSGLSDDTDYSFDTFRRTCFAAGGSAASPSTVTWRWQPLSMIAPGLTASDFRFEIQATYEIPEDEDFNAITTINEGLSNFGLDSTLGNLIAMIATILGAMWLTKNPFVALIAFLGITGFFVIWGLATPLTKVLFAAGAIFAIVLFMRGMRTPSETA